MSARALWEQEETDTAALLSCACIAFRDDDESGPHWMTLSFRSYTLFCMLLDNGSKPHKMRVSSPQLLLISWLQKNLALKVLSTLHPEVLQFHFLLRVLSELQCFHISVYNGWDGIIYIALPNCHMLLSSKLNYHIVNRFSQSKWEVWLWLDHPDCTAE